jgi:hypothetical protein
MSKLFGFQAGVRPNLIRGSGLSAEVGDLRRDTDESFGKLENGGGYFRTEEFTDPDEAVVDHFKTTVATAATARVFSGAALNGEGVDTEMVPPRNPAVTSTEHVHVTAVAVVFTGKLRVNGRLIDHAVPVTLTAGGDTTDEGADVLSIVESIAVPAQGGTGGALEFGFGDLIGLSTTARARAGLLAPLHEIAAGSAGVFTAPVGGKVTVYAPDTAPDGTESYAVTYEIA